MESLTFLLFAYLQKVESIAKKGDLSKNVSTMNYFDNIIYMCIEIMLALIGSVMLSMPDAQ